MREVTARQRALLEAFAAFEVEHGRAPTLRELLIALGRPGSSTNGALEQLRALARKGMVIQLANRRPNGPAWTLTVEGRAEVGAERRCPACGAALDVPVEAPVEGEDT
jgi:hypothetical protein